MRTAIWPIVLRARLYAPPKRLRAEQHVNAERTALPHEAVEQQRRFLRELVVLGEEFLELVDDRAGSAASIVGPAAAR